LSFTIAYILEPVSYFLSGIFLAYYAGMDKSLRIKLLSSYYFLSAFLMVKASIEGVADSSNIEIYNLICLLTSIVIGFYFHASFVGRFKKAVAIFICLVNVGYYVVNNLIFPGRPLFDSTAHVLLSSGIVIMAFMFMHQVLTNVTEEVLLTNFDFWFVCSQLVYFLGAFAIFLTYNYLTQKIIEGFYSQENRILLTNLWSLHNILLFLSSIITSSGIVWIAYRRKSPSL
jgi:hypothetical protein